MLHFPPEILPVLGVINYLNISKGRECRNVFEATVSDSPNESVHVLSDIYHENFILCVHVF